MRTYAFLRENVVVAVLELDEAGYESAVGAYQLGVDITDLTPVPSVGWFLNGNILTPVEDVSEEALLRAKMRARFAFGNRLCDEAIEILSVRNITLGKTSSQVNAMISTFTPIEMAMRKCALPTALLGINAMKPGYPDHIVELDYVTAKISAFLSSEG